VSVLAWRAHLWWGGVVDAVDLAPFRASADKVYADSDTAKAWDAAGLQRVMKA